MRQDVQDELDRLRRENVELRHAVQLMREIADLARESLHPAGVIDAVLTGVTAGVGMGLNRAMLFVTDPDDRSRLVGAAAVGPADREDADRVWRQIEAEGPDLKTLWEAGQRMREVPNALDEQIRAVHIPLDGDSPIARAFRGDALVPPPLSDDCDGLLHGPTGVAAPLRGPAQRLGVLYADNRFTGWRLDAIGLAVFEMVAGHAGRALENARSYAHVLEASRTDALTGLGNHGALMDELSRAVDDARSTSEPLSVVMIDLDDFKRVNDEIGHLEGDRVLAEVARRLSGVVRGEAVYRYGGEELTALLPEADRDTAMAVAERMRRAVFESPFVLTSTSREVSCSLGVAELREGEDAGSLLRRADEALLAAKQGGKNRVVLAR